MTTEEFNIHEWQAKHLRKKINEQPGEHPVAGGGDYYYKSDDIGKWREEREDLMADAVLGIEELLTLLKGQAYELGGDTNGPGIWYDIKKLIREKL